MKEIAESAKQVRNFLKLTVIRSQTKFNVSNWNCIVILKCLFDSLSQNSSNLLNRMTHLKTDRQVRKYPVDFAICSTINMI